MRCLLVVSAVLALAAAQVTDDPNKRCKCEIGTKEEHHHEHEFTVLFTFHNTWDQGCEHSAEDLCREECETNRDVLEAFGGWSVVLPETNSTVGETACQNLDRDVTEHGLESQLYVAVCDGDYHEAGHGIHEPLCCVDGGQVECRHQP